jgi:ElaB/YqjD/DUF883 family membrane-anchored ribosome-binding protein
MTNQSCPEYDRLHDEVTEVLRKVAEIATAQVETFRAKDRESFTKLDKELELTVGQKERTIGGFSQHCKDHNCASWVK